MRNFSKENIIKYLQGELSDKDRHSLERLMLDDPFLNDAIEGLRQVKDPRRLRSMIDSIEPEIWAHSGGDAKIYGPRFPYLKYAMAAVISLAVLFGGYFVVFKTISSPDTLAIQTESKNPEAEEVDGGTREIAAVQPGEDEGTTLPSTDGDTISEEPNIATSEPAENELEMATAAALLPDTVTSEGVILAEAIVTDQEGTEGMGIAGGDTIPQEAAQMDDVLAESTSSQPTEEDRTRRALGVRSVDLQAVEPKTEEPQAFSQDLALNEAALKQKESIPQSSVAGVVIGPDRAPIPGVNIILEGGTLGTVTDVNGRFQLDLPGGANTNKNLVVSFIGYSSKSVPASQLISPQSEIQLDEESNQLSEIIVAGFDDSSGPILFERMALPQGGRIGYRTYLKDNVRYSESNRASGIAGRVIVEFTVGSDGGLSNFLLVKSVSPEYDQELIRLIREGPSWLPAIKDSNPVDAKVRVSLRFKPE